MRHLLERWLFSARLRHALKWATHLVVAPGVCALWLGVAAPNLQLLPGIGGVTDRSAAISLQSALLGIDLQGRAALPPSVRAAQRALGLTPAGGVLSASLLRVRDGAGNASLAVRLSVSPAPAGGARLLDASQTSVPVDQPIAPSSPAPPAPAPAAVGIEPGTPPPLSPAATPGPPAPKPKAVPLPAPHPVPVPPVVPAARTAQTISFTSLPPPNPGVGTPPYVVAAWASSGLPVVFAIEAGSVGVCSLFGTVISFVGAGTCSIDATQPGDARFLAAPQVTQAFAVGSVVAAKSLQSITFTSTPPPGAFVGGAPYLLAASASSGLPVAFSSSAGSSGACVVTGSTVTLVGEGTCRIYGNQAGDANYRPAPQVQQSFVVGRRLQTVSFLTPPPSGALPGAGAYLLAATASSGLPVVFSVQAASAGVCSVVGASVLPVGAGICTIDADQFGDQTYDASTQVQQSFSVGPGAFSRSVQSIQFSSTPPAGAVVGGPSYSVSASSSSGLPAAFSIAASAATVCTLSGSTVSLVGVGTCTVVADQSGNGSYLAAPQVQQSFTVGLLPQTISFTSTPPAGALVGGAPYTVAATASSGLPVAFTADASSAGACTVLGATVTPAGAGMCVIDADQAGNGSYAPATQVQLSFVIAAPSLSTQSIAFTSSAPVSATVGGAAYAVSASASSGLPVSFAIAPASTGICSLSGASVSFAAVGTCTVAADQAGNGSYLAATQVQQSFAVGRIAQTISFTSAPPVGALPTDPDFIVGAISSSGLSVVFSAAASSAGICAVSGSTVSLIGAGTCTIAADQPGSGLYQPAAEVQQSFSVGGGASQSVQSISFTSSAPANAVIGGVAYAVTASASSGLPVSLTLGPSSAGVCSLSGSTVSFVGAGTCTVVADQPGNVSYQAAPPMQQAFAVGLAPQTISFTSSPPSAATVGGGYSVSASASSGLPVTLSIAPGSAAVCAITGAAVSFSSAGTCVVDADQPGGGSYRAASQSQQSFTVAAVPPKSVQTIHFTSSPPAGAVVGGAPYAVTAAASSGLAVTFSTAPSSAGVCTLAGTTVSFVGAGTCTVNADQGGNASYQAAARVAQSVTVSLAPQAINFTSTPPGGAVVGSAAYVVAATASSGLPVAFSVDPSSVGACTIAGATVQIVAAGTCTVDAIQAGNTTFGSASSVQQSFTIGRGSQTITISSTPPEVDKNDPPYTIVATASSGLAVVFTTDPASAGVCSVSGSTVSFSGRGTCIVYANQPGNADYLPAPQVEQVFKVKNHTPA